jgi:hypothetical protein
MGSVNQEIEALKTEIEGYRVKLDNCAPEEQAQWANLITARSATLTELLRQQSGKTIVKFVLIYKSFGHF